MKIILRRDVREIGKQGEIHEVKDAYARNFLIPKGLATIASAAAIAAAEAKRKHSTQQLQRQQATWEQDRQKVSGKTVTCVATANAQGGLFAALKPQDVQRAAAQQYGVRLDDAVLQPDHWKAVGSYPVELRWPNGTTGTITLEITHG